MHLLYTHLATFGDIKLLAATHHKNRIKETCVLCINYMKKYSSALFLHTPMLGNACGVMWNVCLFLIILSLVFHSCKKKYCTS